MLSVFGYGSLLFEPEWPEVVREIVPGRVVGYRRRFNKRSLARGCPVEVARGGAGAEGGDGSWVLDGVQLSVVMGTEPGGAMDGAVIRYPDDVGEEVLARLRRREGCDGERAVEEVHYLERMVEILLEGGRVEEARMWVSNPLSRWYVGGLRADEVARVLWEATPRGGMSGGAAVLASGKARGVEYLLGVRLGLKALGVTADPHVEDVVSAMRRIRRDGDGVSGGR